MGTIVGANSTVKVETRTPPVTDVDGDQVGTLTTLEVNVERLRKCLEQNVSGEVRFDAGSRAMYAHDASNYRMVPIGVVVPKTVEDVIRAVEAARQAGAPILPRGGGTAIPGQGVNTAVLVDFSKYLNRVLEIDFAAKTAWVEPGCNLDVLRKAAGKKGLTFGPDPATHSRNTLGGMIGNNSCGAHSVAWGRTSDNIECLDLLLYDGTRLTVGPTSDEDLELFIGEGGRRGRIYSDLKKLRDKYATLIRERYPKIPRRVSGYNLDELLPEKGFNVARALVGTEGTCATVLRAQCKLVPNPRAKALVVLGFDSLVESADAVPEVLRFHPMACEGFDEEIFEDLKKKGIEIKNRHLLPEGKAWLLVELGDETKGGVESAAQEFAKFLDSKNTPNKLIDDPDLEKALWGVREEALGAVSWVPGEKENHDGWEDSAVHPNDVGAYMRDLQSLMTKYRYHGAIYGHFGDGCLHVRLDFDLETAHGIAKYRRFVQEAANLVTRYGGSLSGEHGDGQFRGELLERMFGPELVEAFAEFKAIWDPDWKMNPGKVVAPFRVDENLELGTAYDPPQLKTRFQFPSDRNSFALAAHRCVGAGVCRRASGGTMCPSYMVTREEKHSTRGRARLLFEMVKGDPVKGSWKSEAVKEALDLCLSCKGCKADCPVQVDMATYKAEFLSHYYEGRVRPRQAYLFGWIQVWAKFASLAPGFINLVGHVPGLRGLIKRIAGVDQARELPEFAPYTFRAWWNARPAKNAGYRKVILWADTFNNHFHPTTGQAAVEVLEDAGFTVIVPKNQLCCGRPLYDYGFVDEGKRYLERILASLRDEIRAGTYIVVLEPSCCSVFRDELLNLFPNDSDAKRLSEQTLLLGEFLNKHAKDYKPPILSRTGFLHGHCHQKAIQHMDDEIELLQKMELDITHPETGCCGMAGGFGFEAGEKYEVSIKCGERALLPALRTISAETLLIADGFSCREQVRQATGRTPMHLAQVIQMGIHEGAGLPVRPYPERRYVKPSRPVGDIVKTCTLVGIVLYGIWRLGGALLSRERC